MNLRTEVRVEDFKNKISSHTRIFLCGSCFTSNIGAFFQKNGFKSSVNPYGVLFNPFSIENCVKNIIQKRQFTSNDFFFSNGNWYSYDLHGEHAQTDINNTIKNINALILEQNAFLSQADFVFLTLGTSFVFELIENKHIVANCHKQKAALFERKLKTAKETVESLQNTISLLKKNNPKVNIILTISPVRHWRDGAFHNQVSKAHLFTALYSVLTIKNVFYFPAYEIVMDELRDYRFYAKDMLHISDLAVEIIWEKLTKALFTNKAMNYLSEISKINKFLEHKPFNAQSEEYKKALLKKQSELRSIETQYSVKQEIKLKRIKDKLRLFDQ